MKAESDEMEINLRVEHGRRIVSIIVTHGGMVQGFTLPFDSAAELAERLKRAIQSRTKH